MYKVEIKNQKNEKKNVTNNEPLNRYRQEAT